MSKTVGSYKVALSIDVEDSDVTSEIDEQFKNNPPGQDLPDEFEDRGEESGGRFSEGFKAAVGKVALVSGAGFAASLGIAKSLLNDAESGIQAYKQTEAVIASTGKAAGVTASEVVSLSEDLARVTGIDDELIHNAQNLLMTFKNVKNEAGEGNDIFTQATHSLVDMAAAMGTDPKAAAMQLGKALNDPIKGVSALGRVGVTFSKSQQEVIKNLVETGKTAEAQRMILKELDSQFAGSAEAQATASSKIEASVGMVRGSLGEALLPIYEDLAEIVLDDVIPVVEKFAAFLNENPAAVKILAVGVAALGAAFVVATAAMVLMNLAFLANPITWVVLGVVALVAALVMLVNWIRGLGIDWGAFWGDLGGGMKDALIGTPEAIKNAWSSFKDWISGVWDSIKAKFDETIGAIKMPEFNLFGGDSGGSGGGGGFLGIPAFATGGVVNGPTIGLIGEAGPEAVIPLDRLNSMLDVSGDINSRSSSSRPSVTYNTFVEQPKTKQEQYAMTKQAVRAGMML